MAEYLIQEETLKAIADAIRGKTGSTDPMTLSQMPKQLEPLADVSTVTARAADVLTGKTIVDSNGSNIDGSMPIHKTSKVMYESESHIYTIPEGYHDGTGTVRVETTSKTVTPTKSKQIVYDDASMVISRYLTSVTVNPIPNQYQDVTNVTATADSVREGQIFVDASGTEQVGTLAVWEGGSY